MKKVICENASGDRLTLTHAFPLWLRSISGIYEIKHTITTAKAAGQDGETLTGSTADRRNIVIILQIKDDYARQRDRLYNFFQPDEDCTLFYYEGSVERKIGYRVESIDCPENGVVRNTTISLECGSPLFEDITETRVTLSAWQGLIEFPVDIINPFEVTEKLKTLMQNIYNASSAVLGLRLRFTASGEVTTPKIVDVNRHLVLAAELTMHTGDVLEITTGKSNKRVTLTRNGISNNVINTITYPPQWVQLHRGDNLIRYDADAGIDSLSVDIFYRNVYWGC